MTIAGRTMQLIQIGGKRATLQIISVILVFDQVYACLGTSAYTTRTFTFYQSLRNVHLKRLIHRILFITNLLSFSFIRVSARGLCMRVHRTHGIPNQILNLNRAYRHSPDPRTNALMSSMTSDPGNRPRHPSAASTSLKAIAASP